MFREGFNAQMEGLYLAPDTGTHGGPEPEKMTEKTRLLSGLTTIGRGIARSVLVDHFQMPADFANFDVLFDTWAAAFVEHVSDRQDKVIQALYQGDPRLALTYVHDQSRFVITGILLGILEDPAHSPLTQAAVTVECRKFELDMTGRTSESLGEIASHIAGQLRQAYVTDPSKSPPDHVEDLAEQYLERYRASLEETEESISDEEETAIHGMFISMIAAAVVLNEYGDDDLRGRVALNMIRTFALFP